MSPFWVGACPKLACRRKNLLTVCFNPRQSGNNRSTSLHHNNPLRKYYKNNCKFYSQNAEFAQKSQISLRIRICKNRWAQRGKRCRKFRMPDGQSTFDTERTTLVDPRSTKKKKHVFWPKKRQNYVNLCWRSVNSRSCLVRWENGTKIVTL